jgi:uncharacterized protein
LPEFWHYLENAWLHSGLGKQSRESQNVSQMKRGEVTFYVEWDERKNRLNQKKHHVSFEEASTVFLDPFELTVDDPAHAVSEYRFISIGQSFRRRLLVVSYKEFGDRIRIITARRPTRNERRDYEETRYA